MIMAAKEKDRLENKQRAARQEREENGIAYTPAYFVEYQNPEDEQVYYVYNNQYYSQDRKHQRWDRLSDLFGQD